MVQDPNSLNIVCLLIVFSLVRHLNVDENCTLLSYYAARMINPYRRIGTTHPRILKVRPINCPETSVRNYDYTMCNIPEERSSLLVHLCVLGPRYRRLRFVPCADRDCLCLAQYGTRTALEAHFICIRLWLDACVFQVLRF